MAEKAAAPKAANKSAIYASLSESTGLSKKQISTVFDELGKLIKKEISKKGPGVFQVPGVLKLRAINKPATKAKQAPNPFKPGEMMTIKAKPARKVIKASPLKALKDSV